MLQLQHLNYRAVTIPAFLLFMALAQDSRKMVYPALYSMGDTWHKITDIPAVGLQANRPGFQRRGYPLQCTMGCSLRPVKSLPRLAEAELFHEGPRHQRMGLSSIRIFIYEVDLASGNQVCSPLS